MTAPAGGAGEILDDAVARAAKVLDVLRDRGATLGFCESLTAGLTAATVAAVPGASDVLRGGLVTYATELKHRLAGVDAAVLAEVGPVAAETARQMATGARRRIDCDWAVSLTGVAGPTEQDGHPVGEVWVGVAGPDGVTARRHACSGDRAQIRAAAVAAALNDLDERLRG